MFDRECQIIDVDCHAANRQISDFKVVDIRLCSLQIFNVCLLRDQLLRLNDLRRDPIELRVRGRGHLVLVCGHTAADGRNRRGRVPGKINELVRYDQHRSQPIHVLFDVEDLFVRQAICLQSVLQLQIVCVFIRRHDPDKGPGIDRTVPCYIERAAGEPDALI